MKRLLFLAIFATFVNAQSLKSLIDYATTHNTAINKAKLDSKISKWRLKAASAQKRGELNIVGSATHYNTPRTLAPVLPGSKAPVYTTRNIYSLGLNYSVKLFTGFSQTSDVELGSIASKMSSAKLNLTKFQIAYNVKVLYYNALSIKELLKAQKSYANALKREYLTIKKEVKYGKRALIDELKAKASWQDALVGVESLKANLEISKANLSSIVGKDVTKIDAINVKVKRPKVSVKRLYAYANSLQKVAIENLKIEKSNKEIKKAKATKYPFVSLNAYAGKNYGNDRVSDKWKSEDVAQVSINVQYNLYDGGKRDSNIEVAKLNKLKSSLDRVQTMRDLKKQITTGVAKLKLSYSKYLGAISQYRLAKKALEIEKELYKSGRSTINDLLLANAKSFIARAKVIEAKYEYANAKSFIDYIMEGRR